jgi:hypothetical protein
LKAKYQKEQVPGGTCFFYRIGYLWSVFRRTGEISRATAPPINAVISWGQEKVTGRAFNIGAFRVPAANKFSDMMPQITFTINLLYCFVYGAILSLILSRNIPSNDPFANYNKPDEQ